MPVLCAEMPSQTASWQSSLVWFPHNSQILLTTKEKNGPRVARRDSVPFTGGRASGEPSNPCPVPGNFQAILSLQHSAGILSKPQSDEVNAPPHTKVGPDRTHPVLSLVLIVEVLRTQQDRLAREEVTQPQSTLGNLLCWPQTPRWGLVDQSPFPALSEVNRTGLIKACMGQKRSLVSLLCLPSLDDQAVCCWDASILEVSARWQRKISDARNLSI